MDGVTEVFGQWLTTCTTVDHYFLGGKTLCGEPRAGLCKRPDRNHPTSGNIDTRHRCPLCHILNLNRWAVMFTTPSAAAPSPAPSPSPASRG